MNREMLAGAVLVWLIGALVGWGVGWAARGEQNRAWYAGLRRQLEASQVEVEQLHHELAEALDALDQARAEPWRATRMPAPAPPAVVQLNLAVAVPPALVDPPGAVAPAVVSARPVWPARGGQ